MLRFAFATPVSDDSSNDAQIVRSWQANAAPWTTAVRDNRIESRTLPREASFCYATESMRLTTRLMQLASWLLLQRAVNEGDYAYIVTTPKIGYRGSTPIPTAFSP